MEIEPTRNRSLTKFDGAVAVFFGVLCGWAIHESYAAAQDAIRRYGHNVDSGALVGALAILYLGPVALLFGLAAAAMWRNWRLRWALHWFAVACAGLPLVYVGVSLLFNQ